jgi:hypothetical protein
LRDVTFRLAPIREFSAHRMIEDTRASAILRGTRGEGASDIDAVVTSLLRFIWRSNAPVAELDINPLFVYARGGAPLRRADPSGTVEDRRARCEGVVADIYPRYPPPAPPAWCGRPRSERAGAVT